MVLRGNRLTSGPRNLQDGHNKAIRSRKLAQNFYNAVSAGPKVERTLEDFSVSQLWITYSALNRRVDKICTILYIPEGPRWQNLMP